MTERKNFKIVTGKSGATFHITGFEFKTVVGDDRSNITGAVPYAPDSHCSGLTRIEWFVFNFPNSGVKGGADTIAELAEIVAAKQSKGYRFCAKCLGRLAEAVDAEKSEPVAETFELTYEVMNSKGEISRRNVSGPADKQDAAVAEILSRSDFISFVN